MPSVIVVGVQWGDEGKGKIVDYLTEHADFVVRFQGGNNAGHTVIVGDRRFALKLIPSGILRNSTRCLLASSVVLNPVALLEEFKSLSEAGIEVTPERFGIAGEVTLVLPYHKAIDAEREQGLADSKIGTTGRGIGPAYEDSVSRFAVRLADLFDQNRLREMIARNVEHKNRYLKGVLNSSVQFDPDQVFGELVEIAQTLRPYMTNVSIELAEAFAEQRCVVFEGAQGCLLDINHGTYPYVTSSNTLSGCACVSAGFGPQQIDFILGICKAYTTRVGSGPFPSEDSGSEGDQLREVGKEFGTVTGRPRRCGWFDTVAIRRTTRLNGVDSLIITKLDVLTGLKRIRIGVSYTLDGQSIADLPVSCADIERVEVKYEEMDGWQEDISEVRSFEQLPEAAKHYLRRIEELVGCPVGGVSVGPERSQTIIMDKRISSLALRGSLTETSE